MLKDRRAAFLKQQERVQGLSVQIADAAAVEKTRVKQEPGVAPVAAAAVTAGSNSGVPAAYQNLQPERWLQDAGIYSQRLHIQRLPVGQKLKKIIDLLYRERRGLTAQEVEAGTWVDVTNDEELKENLRTNPKIQFDGERYMYKPKHELTGKDSLLKLIRQHKDGVLICDVRDAYPEVLAHVQDLKASGHVWVLHNIDSSEDVVYPNDPRLTSSSIHVDADLQALLRGIDIPRDFKDMEKELQRAGQQSLTAALPKIQAVDPLQLQSQKGKGKKRRESKRTKYTNNHLPELFQNT